MRQVRTCAYGPCEETFEPTKHYEQRYCSPSCSNLARGRRVIEGDKDCAACGTRLERKPREGVRNFLTRRYCDRSCAGAGKSLHEDWELEEELNFLLGTDTPESIAQRLGYADIHSLYNRMAKSPELADLKERLQELHNEYLDAAIR